MTILVARTKGRVSRTGFLVVEKMHKRKAQGIDRAKNVLPSDTLRLHMTKYECVAQKEAYCSTAQ